MKIGPALVVVAAMAVCLAAVASLAWKAGLPYKGYSSDSIKVVIEPGKPARAAVDRLKQAGVIRSALAFRLMMRVRRAEERIHAGEYEFAGSMTPGEVLDKLVRGDIVLHKVTIPEGLRIDETADVFAAAGFGPREAFLEAARDVRALDGLDSAAADLEGYLFPDTYLLAMGATPRSIVAEMVGRFRREMTPERMARTKELGLSLREVVTLASLVEEEAGVDDERARIAAVFRNRLRMSMLLQCDPTVVYSLVRDNKYRGRIYHSDLEYPSVYNTYLKPGLPPGPICSPGARSLEAALYPAQTGELYFVVSGPGRHRFSTNIQDHQQAVRRYREESRLQNRIQ